MQAISIKNLTKIYPDGMKALDCIHLDIKQGDFFALLGPNGAGKSTTIGIITSLVNKTNGQIRIFGHDIDNDFPTAKTFIGVVPQEFNCNVFETVEQILVTQAGYYGVPRKIAFQRAELYLKKLDLWKKRHSISRTLSGGMKRRLMIARALMHEPKLLILDEPTAGVDIEMRRAMWDFFQEINKQGTTVILTTHYLEEAEYLCQNIAIIDQGHIVENTSMKQLLTKLQMETFVLNVAKNLKFAPELQGFNCRLIDESTIEIDIYKQQPLNTVFSELTEQGIDVLSLRNKTNRLETLFLGLINQEIA